MYHSVECAKNTPQPLYSEYITTHIPLIIIIIIIINTFLLSRKQYKTALTPAKTVSVRNENRTRKSNNIVCVIKNKTSIDSCVFCGCDQFSEKLIKSYGI